MPDHLITLAIAIAGAAGTVLLAIWTFRGKLDALVLKLELAIAGVMSETKQQTIKLDTLAVNLTRVEASQKDHDAKDDRRFDELAKDNRTTRHRAENVAGAVGVLQGNVDRLERNEDRRQSKSATPYPPIRKPGPPDSDQ